MNTMPKWSWAQWVKRRSLDQTSVRLGWAWLSSAEISWPRTKLWPASLPLLKWLLPLRLAPADKYPDAELEEKMGYMKRSNRSITINKKRSLSVLLKGEKKMMGLQWFWWGSNASQKMLIKQDPKIFSWEQVTSLLAWFVDLIVFTEFRRILWCKGVIGKKTSYKSLPYRSIPIFSRNLWSPDLRHQNSGPSQSIFRSFTPRVTAASLKLRM